MSVYIITSRELGAAKLGYSLSPISRLVKLQTGCPAKIDIEAIIPADRRCEKSLHKRFASDRRFGEWFNINDEIESLIRAFPYKAGGKQAGTISKSGEAKIAFRFRHIGKKADGLPVGVQFHRGRYRAVIWINGKRHRLGWFTNPEEAGQAFIRAAEEADGSIWLDPHISMPIHAAPVAGEAQ